MNRKVLYLMISIALLTLTVCVSPKQWPAETHQDMMMACKEACGNRMTGYLPFNGACKCRKK